MSGMMPIPWSSIAQYGSFYGFHGDDFDDLLHLIREMDNAMLEEVRGREKLRQPRQ